MPALFMALISLMSLPLHAARHPAAIQRGAIALASPSSVFFGDNGSSISPELIASFNQIIFEQQQKFNVSHFIPEDITETEPAHRALSRIADKSVNYLFKQSELSKSKAAQLALQAEQSMSQEVALGQTASINHRLVMNVQAFSGVASLKYEGYLRAAIKYTATNDNLDVEFAESLDDKNDLVLSHSLNRGAEEGAKVALRWSF